jgi:signal peptidase I
MHHYENGFEKIFGTSDIYDENNISLDNTKNWVFQNGFNKGDIIFVVGAENVKVGDVIIFNGGARYPLIHRVVSAGETYGTKGDNYKSNPTQLSVEEEIQPNQIMGKALFKIPHIGWAKLIFFELSKSPNDRGLCN